MKQTNERDGELGPGAALVAESHDDTGMWKIIFADRVSTVPVSGAVMAAAAAAREEEGEEGEDNQFFSL